jgi:hypothetical protein
MRLTIQPGDDRHASGTDRRKQADDEGEAEALPDQARAELKAEHHLPT